MMRLDTIARATLGVVLLALAIPAQAHEDRRSSVEEKSMASKKIRIPAIAPADFDEKQRELAKPGTGRENLNLTRTMVNHPALYEKWMAFSEQLVFSSSLPLREREILTLKTVSANHGEYELAHHATVGKSVGLTDAEMAAAKGDGTGLPPFEQALVRAAGELVADSAISEATWNILAERYNTQQMMEVVFLVGNYSLIAMATNSFGVQVEEGVDKVWKPYQ